MNTVKQISFKADAIDMDKILLVKNKLGFKSDSAAIHFILKNFSLNDTLVEIQNELKKLSLQAHYDACQKL